MKRKRSSFLSVAYVAEQCLKNAKMPVRTLYAIQQSLLQRLGVDVLVWVISDYMEEINTSKFEETLFCLSFEQKQLSCRDDKWLEELQATFKDSRYIALHAYLEENYTYLGDFVPSLPFCSRPVCYKPRRGCRCGLRLDGVTLKHMVKAADQKRIKRRRKLLYG